MSDRARMRSAFASATAVAATVGVAYAVWVVYYASHRPVVSLAHVGYQFQHRDDRSESIAALPSRVEDYSGYDGQFSLYVALDPGNARYYLDAPAYRLSRPLYPLAARALALGRPTAIPWTLLLLGIAGVVVGTFAVATLLRDEGISAWYAAVFGFYPGLFVGVSWDLTEPLAYGLVALGLLAFGSTGRRPLVAAACFAAAGVTRETTLLFAIALAAWLVWRPRRRREAALMLVISVAPYVLVKAALAIWLHSSGAARASRIELAPLLGLVRSWPWDNAQLEQLLSVVAPALLALGLAIAATRRLTPGLSALTLNVLILVVLLPEPSYADYLASGRITTGVVLASLMCLPAILKKQWTAQAWIAIALWMAPWYFWLPTAFER